MIRNEQQYRIMKTHVLNFEKALRDLPKDNQENSSIHPLLRKAEEEALRSQWLDLKRQVEEYESLKSGKLKVFEVGSFDELPTGLIRARIAKGLSQKVLAEKLGMKEQQIQRYEATDYSTASFERIKQVIKALDIQINKEIFISNGLFSRTTLLKNLKAIGLDSEIVLNRLLPFELAQRIENITEYLEEEAKHFLLQAASIIGKILRIEPKSLFEQKPLEIDVRTLKAAKFKKNASTDVNRISAYTIYAHTLALLVLEATKDIKPRQVPQAKEMRQNVIKKYSIFNLQNLVKYIWDLGIPVIPLRDPGSFHGACWRVDGRNIIVLKQKTMSEARWMHDLSHEAGHTGQRPSESSLEIIEPNLEAKDWIETQDEKDANYFAGELVLGESADDLAEEAILSAKKDLVKLKSSVIKIAEREKIAPGALANYIAFRLRAEQGINWWGTAHNLQNVVSDPFEITRDILMERIKLERLNEGDQQLLLRALI